MQSAIWCYQKLGHGNKVQCSSLWLIISEVFFIYRRKPEENIEDIKDYNQKSNESN